MKRAGTSIGGGVVFWENKSSVAACHGPGDARGWRSSAPTGSRPRRRFRYEPRLHCRDPPRPGYPNPNPGQPHHPASRPTLMGPHRSPASCKDGGTGCAPAGGGGGHRWQLPRLRARAAVVEKKKNKPQLPVGSAVGCRKPPKFANGFTPAARAPRGHGCAGQAHPSLCCRWDPHPKRLSPLGALPGRVRPQPPAGSLPGRGGSQEGKNQKQIAGVNGAEPRAASAAAV